MANQILIEDLSEQLAIEEDFFKAIEQQILEIIEDSFSDAKVY